MIFANRHRILHCAVLAVVATASISRAQTALTGSSLVLKSSGTASLSSAGYVGTYLTVPAGGATVHFTVNASSAAGTGAAPHMNLVIADSVTGFSLASTSSTAYTTPDVALPAGTYLVRAERDYPSNVGVTRSLTVTNLSVSTVSGSGAATFVNSSTDDNALAAANTYIENFRQGSAIVALTGPGGVPLLPGTPVHVELARHAFNFGTAVPGSSSSTVNAYFGSTGTVQQTSYQSHLNQNFNAVVPENMGKWASDEATRGVTTMGGVDTILNYAQSHNMRARMHNVIWGSQQPSWVNTLLTSAGNGSATAKSDLRSAISSRIDYYVGTGSAATDRAGKYAELDVYNESYHTGAAAIGNNNYWKIYGPAGVADIYNEVAQTVASYPNPPKLFVNDYNVLQNSNDAYANWYASHVSQLRDAGGAVGGIGIQYYPNPSIGPGDTQHSPARIAAVLQNLSTQEIPLALTEFGVGTGGTQATAAQILDQTLRLAFGTPGTTGFFTWGFQDEGNGNLFKPGAALYTVSNNFSTWTITEAGKRWQDLLGIQDWDGDPSDAWHTSVDTTVSAAGAVSFTGYYGDYYLRGQTSGAYDLTLGKGTTAYATSLAAPATWSLWNPAASGAWGQASNWSAGGVPGTAGFTAYFGPAAAGRGVALNSDQVVGMVVFDSAGGSYNLAGPGTLTLRGFAGSDGHIAAIRVVAGSHSVSAPVVLADATTVDVAASSGLALSDLRPSPAVGVTKSGPGELYVNAIQAASLAISQGTVRLTGGGQSPSLLASLTISPGSSLDLGDSPLTLTPADGTPISQAAHQVRQFLLDHRLFSSAADNDPARDRAIAYAPAGSGSLLIREALIGDANLDGSIDGDDYALIDRSFGQSVADGGWIDGDFNYDGAVTAADYLLIDRSLALLSGGLAPSLVADRQARFGDAYLSELLAGVPEPSVMGLIVAAFPVVFRRRR